MKLKDQKEQNKIMTLMIYRSKKNKKIGHVIAILFPCNHKKYLGRATFPPEVKEDSTYVYDVTIWKPYTYTVTHNESCRNCPPDEYWLDDIDLTPNLEDTVTALDNLGVL